MRNYKGFKVAVPSHTASVNRYGWKAVVFATNSRQDAVEFHFHASRPELMFEKAVEWIDNHSEGFTPR